MHEEPDRLATWDGAVEARAIDQRQTFDPFQHLEGEPRCDTTTRGTTLSRIVGKRL
jgi:hypothetical protein